MKRTKELVKVIYMGVTNLGFYERKVAYGKIITGNIHYNYNKEVKSFIPETVKTIVCFGGDYVGKIPVDCILKDFTLLWRDGLEKDLGYNFNGVNSIQESMNLLSGFFGWGKFEITEQEKLKDLEVFKNFYADCDYAEKVVDFIKSNIHLAPFFKSYSSLQEDIKNKSNYELSNILSKEVFSNKGEQVKILYDKMEEKQKKRFENVIPFYLDSFNKEKDDVSFDFDGVSINTVEKLTLNNLRLLCARDCKNGEEHKRLKDELNDIFTNATGLLSECEFIDYNIHPAKLIITLVRLVYVKITKDLSYTHTIFSNFHTYKEFQLICKDIFQLI